MKAFCDRHHIFYGWVIVIASLFVLGGSYGISYNCFALTVKPVSEAYGFSRSAYTFCMTIRLIFYTLAAGFSGRIYRRLRPLALVRISLIVLAAAHCLQYFAGSLGVFYVLYIFLGAATPLCSFTAFTVIISNWFQEKRGTAIGICFMGSGIGGMIFSTLSGNWIVKYGMNMTYVIQAAAIVLTTFPAAFLIIRERPEDMGLKAFGEAADAADSGSPVVYGYTMEEGLKKKNFWLLVLVSILLGFTTTLLAANITPHFSDIGFSSVYSANMNAAYLGTVSVMKIIMGMLFDRFDTKKVSAIGTFGVIIACVCLLFSRSPVLHPFVIFAMAVAGSLGTVSFPILVTYGAGNRDYAAISGILTAGSSLGGAFSPIVANGIYDARHSYNGAFIVTAALTAVCILLILALNRVSKPEEA